jgi:hypothetical protein
MKISGIGTKFVLFYRQSNVVPQQENTIILRENFHENEILLRIFALTTAKR